MPDYFEVRARLRSGAVASNRSARTDVDKLVSPLIPPPVSDPVNDPVTSNPINSESMSTGSMHSTSSQADLPGEKESGEGAVEGEEDPDYQEKSSRVRTKSRVRVSRKAKARKRTGSSKSAKAKKNKLAKSKIATRTGPTEIDEPPIVESEPAEMESRGIDQAGGNEFENQVDEAENQPFPAEEESKVPEETESSTMTESRNENISTPVEPALPADRNEPTEIETRGQQEVSTGKERDE